MSRTGRRSGTPGTREAILSVARRRFATRGYDATSLRGIAAEAGVDPALVIHYFGTKEGLFVAAAGLPTGLSSLFGSLATLPVDECAPALVRGYLHIVDSDKSRNAILALVRSAVSNDKAAAMLREFLTAELLPVIARLTGRQDARLKASLVAAQLMGIAMLRHVIRIDPLAGASPDDIVALVTPAINQYLEPRRMVAMVDVDGSRSFEVTADVMWAVVADPARLADWVPTMRRAEPSGEAEVHLEGESHGHRYSLDSLLSIDEGERLLRWGAEGDEGYRGWLRVADRPPGSEVHIHVAIPDDRIGLPADAAAAELRQGLEDAFDRLSGLTAT